MVRHHQHRRDRFPVRWCCMKKGSKKIYDWQKQLSGNVSLLRPHVKTNKIAEVCRLMLDAGITKFKCATIAEAEMLAQVQAPDVMLAYQPIGPKAQRFINLIKTYPATHFSCLIDNREVATDLSAAAAAHQLTIDVYIDLNVGMNRTGIVPGDDAFALFQQALALRAINPVGLHAYDGQIKAVDPRAPATGKR